SSKVVIDGTSQPGDAFGESDARVRIMPNPGVYGDQNDGGLIIMNAANIEIYGLHITGFYLSEDAPASRNLSYSAIRVTGGSSITIGKPGAGNVFDDNSVHINIARSQTNTSSDIALQSNWIGIGIDGEENRGSSGTIALRVIGSDVQFGGM